MIDKLIEKYRNELEELETMKTGYVAYYGERTKCKEILKDLEELTENIKKLVDAEKSENKFWYKRELANEIIYSKNTEGVDTDE